MATYSLERLAAEISDLFDDDPEGEKAFRADPVRFLEESTGTKLPPGKRIVIHDNTDDVWHVPLPATRAKAEDAHADDFYDGTCSPRVAKIKAQMRAEGWVPPEERYGGKGGKPDPRAGT